jgi:tetratricopeptide (TPR) repeat protein
VHLLIVGGTREERLAHARRVAGAAAYALDASALPFIRPSATHLPQPSPRVISIDDIERAFPNAQSGGTRLVLTQSTYIVQAWVDVLASDARIIATGDKAALERDAAEAFKERGPWASFRVVDIDSGTELFATEFTEHMEPKPVSQLVSAAVFPVSSAVEILIRAYHSGAADERARLCRDAAALAPDSAVGWLALASACREGQDMNGARDALDRAAALAPDWAAVHYEDGKFWLGYDDVERASRAFQRAADLMPSFSSAFSNLGATLGELDRPDQALAAFRHALAHDPRSFTLLNNVGVVSRELGHLDESEAAFARVIELAPEFVFGHYNLGHTLFLAGKYRPALAAYEEGQRRDPEKNTRQACRLALMRLANGDAAGAARDLWNAVNASPADEREDLLLEAHEIAHALLEHHPELAAYHSFLDRITAALSGPSS